MEISETYKKCSQKVLTRKQWVDEDEQDAVPEDADYMNNMAGGAGGMPGMPGMGGEDGGFGGIGTALRSSFIYPSH